MLQRKQKSKMKKGDAINVINSTAQQLYLVSRYEQHTYQRSVCMYVYAHYQKKQDEKRKEKQTRQTRRMSGRRGPASGLYV